MWGPEDRDMKLRADRRDERRSEALQRNEAWGALSIAEKLRRIAERPGNAERQRMKLCKQLEEDGSTTE